MVEHFTPFRFYRGWKDDPHCLRITAALAQLTIPKLWRGPTVSVAIPHELAIPH